MKNMLSPKIFIPDCVLVLPGMFNSKKYQKKDKSIKSLKLNKNKKVKIIPLNTLLLKEFYNLIRREIETDLNEKIITSFHYFIKSLSLSKI